MRKAAKWTGSVGMSLMVLAAAAAARGEDSPLAVLRQEYSPYMSEKDPWGFDQKICAMRGGAYRYWRGSKDDFFTWARTNCPDWLADEKAYIVQHADVHLGNVGTYVTDLRTGKLAFGLVDFDDSAKAPIQLEALAGLVTLRVLAADKDLTLSDAQKAAADKVFLDAYVAALGAGRTATEILKDDSWVKPLFEAEGAESAYAKMVKKYFKHGEFVLDRHEKGNADAIKEVLIPAENVQGPTASQVAAALAKMVAEQPAVQSVYKPMTAAELQTHVQGVVRRVRLSSAGSQGQKKWFVLLDAGATVLGHDLIVYFKEEIPSAALRAGLGAKDERNPAQRLVEDVQALTSPSPAGYGWADLGQEHYWVSVHEPWGADGDPDLVNLPRHIPEVAKVLGVAAGASHGQAVGGPLAGRFDPATLSELVIRADLYTEHLVGQYHAFVADKEVTAIAAARAIRWTRM